ncbi:GEVED domain-containing protein [Cloacibacterium normanense]|uniref:Ig-like domain-containing protein n=1 Tax=Cloacibacterium normanense TaxID=237258 RepID=UPI00391D7901
MRVKIYILSRFIISRKKFLNAFFFVFLSSLLWGQVTLPYTEDFEGTGNKGWTLENGSANKWFVGSAVNNGGSRSLYISDDASGANNNYANTASVNHAYIDFSVPAGVTKVGLSFDWRANGEVSGWWFPSNVDYLQVWLVPVSFTPVAGAAISTVGGRTLVASLNRSNSFSKGIYDLNVTANSNMRLVFSWINDGSIENQNAAAIDNVHLSSCSQGAMYINDVKFIGSLNPDTDNTSGYTAGGTADYTALPDKGKQVPGGGMNVFVETLSSVTNYLGSSIEAWIDWNNDGIYSSSENVYTASDLAESTTFGFVVPAGTAAGTYKIKISATFSPSSGSRQTCVGSTFTETEIYSFYVIDDCATVISSVKDNYSCGTGSVTLSAVGNGTSYKWYTTRFGGSPIDGATSSTYITPSISSTTTYYVTAESGTCESVYRTPVIASVIPTTSLSLTTNNAEICGENSSLIISATGDKEEYEFFKEDFESGIGASNRFNGVTVTSTGNSTNNNTSRWKQKTSTFIPTGATWKPAISSGPGTNKFAFATSDINGDVEPNKVNTALSMNTSYAINPLAQNMLNLYMTFDLYYSWYGDQNATTKDNLFIEISKDGGITWIPTTAATPDTNIRISKDNGLTWSNTNIVDYRWGNGTRFENLLVDLSYYRTQSNFSVRFRYNCGWGDGIALDNVRIYGDRPLPTAPTWSASGITFYQSNCSTPLLSTDKTSSVCIKPTLDELENNASWNIIANVVLHNGCSGIGSVTISNDTKVWNQPVSVNDWGVTNWKPSSPLPNLTKCVVVRTPVILPTGSTGTHGSAKNVVVKSGGKLTIDPKSSLTIQNYLKNEAAPSDVLVESDANLLQINDYSYENEGNITVKRNANLQRLDYNYWGSPVKGQTFKPFSPYTKITRFYTYDPRDDSFVTVADLNSEFIEAKGYAIMAPDNYNSTTQIFEGKFVGMPNNGVKQIALDYSEHPVTHVYGGRNMIANPYPSNIDLKKLAQKNADLTDGIYYFWTTDARSFQNNVTATYGIYGNYKVNQYAILNALGSTPATASATSSTKLPSHIIKPGQGFIIKAKAAGNLVFDNSIRTVAVKDDVNRDAVFFNRIGNAGTTKKTESLTNEDIIGRYWLALISPVGAKSVTLVGYVADATNDFDAKYDTSIAMSSSDNFYTMLGTKKNAIQGRSPLDIKSDRVSLGMSNFISGKYTIKLENKDGVFANGQNVYVKDNQTGIIQELKDSEGYSFETNAGVIEGRFEIVYQNESTLVTQDVVKDNGVMVYRDNNALVIKSNSNINQVELFDVAGVLIYKKDNISKKQHIIYNNLIKGFYFLKIIDKDGVKTRKISYY